VPSGVKTKREYLLMRIPLCCIRTLICQAIGLLAMTATLFSAPACGFAEPKVDPLNGDDRNDGITAPVRSVHLLNRLHRPILSHASPPSRLEQFSQVETQQFVNDNSQTMDRIILGAKPITDWKAMDRPPIWTARLERQPTEVRCDGAALITGCNKDLLEDGSWIWDSQTSRLFIAHATGNPDQTGSIITAHFGTSPITAVVTGWTRAPNAIWQTPMPTQPRGLHINDTLYENWWWGTTLVCNVAFGVPDTLYLIDSDGHPQETGKVISIAEETGGWSVASGDFNGDDLIDVIHSNLAPEVYVNYGSETFSSIPDQILKDPEGDSIMGFYVASAGDIDRNGCDDLIVAMNWGNHKVYLYMGTPQGLNTTPDITLRPPQGYPEFGFGHNISTAGDINGDGNSDLLIAGGDGANVFIYLGTRVGVRTAPDLVLSYSTEHVANVSYAGDLNGDGLDEIAVCLSVDSPENVFRIAIYNGASNGLDPSPQKLSLNLPPGKSSLAGQVSWGGDINADGYEDLLIGNQWAQNTFENEGEVYLFLGSASGLSETADAIVENPLPEFNVRFGSTLDGIGDFNGDGFDDIIIGCPYGPVTNANGFAAVFTGGPEGIGATPLTILYESEYFGWSVSHAGDIRGNGQNFILVGEEFGGAYLYALPVVTIDTLMDFFIQSVANGTLTGIGSKETAQMRLTIFGIILYSANWQLNNGRTEIACRLLLSAAKTCDQSPAPPDLVTGSARPQLFQMLLDLMETMSCNANKRSSLTQEKNPG
jgi:hypothetical protein